MELISKAKAALILDQPFFASILLGLPMSEDNSIPTMATDGDSIRYNTKWVSTLTLQEVLFVLAHETLHCAFLHMTRRGDRNPTKWNIAADYVINDVLVKERIGSMPKGGLHDSALVAKGGGTTEGVYKLLPKGSENKEVGKPGGPMDQVCDAGSMGEGQNVPDQHGNSSGRAMDQATQSQKEADMRVKIIQAKNAAKSQGKLSAGLERLVGTLVKVRTDWKSVLRRFLSESAKLDLSYAKPKRRFLAEDLYLPSLIGERLGPIAIAVDCSGSVSAEVLNRFGAEVSAILEDAKPSSVKILYFDSEVLRTQDFEADQPVKLETCGGGGTAFSPVIKELNKLDVPPVACVFLTDLQCSDFGAQPDFPVLWATTDLEAAPYGEILKIDEEG